MAIVGRTGSQKIKIRRSDVDKLINNFEKLMGKNWKSNIVKI